MWDGLGLALELETNQSGGSAGKYGGFLETLGLLERRRFRGPGHLVSSADWMPSTVRTPVSLSHWSDEA